MRRKADSHAKIMPPAAPLAPPSVQDVALDPAHELDLLRQTCGASRHEWVSVRRRDGCYVYVSPNCEALTGYTAQEMLADKMLMQQIVHPHDHWLLERHLTQEWEAHASLLCVLRLTHRSGSVRWIEHTCAPLFDESGAWIGRRSVNRDITDSKMLEQTLEEARHDTAGLFHALQYPAFIVDQEQRITAVNAPAQQLLGMREKEIVGQPCHELLSKNVLPEGQCPLQQCLASGAVTTLEAHNTHTRAVFLITCAPLPSNNQARRALITLVDVSALHRARLSSEENERRYRLQFEDMPVALLEEDFSDIKHMIETVRASGVQDFNEYCRRNPKFISDCAARVRVRAMNKAARTLGGVAQVDDYVQQRGTLMTEVSWNTMRDSILAIACGRTTFAVDSVVCPRPNDAITIQLSWTIAPGHEASCDRVLLCLIDLTDRQRLQDELILAHKARAIEALAGGIAHEFNNLLTIISGNLSLLLIDMAGTHPCYDKLKTMEHCVEQGAEVTWRLLGFAHSGTLLRHPLELNALLQRNQLILQRLCGSIRLTVVAAGTPLLVDVDRLQIEQAIVYLLLNLTREAQNTATLTLQASLCVLTDEHARRLGIAPGAYASIVLGKPDYVAGREQACDPTDVRARTHTPVQVGTALANTIVAQHRGVLGMAPDGAGAPAYRMLLPVSARAEEAADAVEDPAAFPLGNGETVLVVDDENLVVTVAGLMLTRLGYTPLLAQTSQEACALMEQHRADIKVVILDIIMPDMTCEEIYLQLHARQPKARFLLASGYAHNAKALGTLTDRHYGYIQKPLQLQILATLLHAALTA
ncbi:MAG: PAS domain-containing protein [bacterium]|nr:PAS domain-containing protein [bacterium]